MDKLQELRQKYKALTDEIRALNNDGKVDEASAKLEERKNIQKQIDVEVALQEEEKRQLEAEKRKKEEEGRAKGAGNEKKPVNEFRSAVKYAMGGETRSNMTEEERAVVKTSDNAAVIPDEFINDTIKVKDGFGSLKKYCDVRPVKKNKGTIPVVDLEQNEMKDVPEGDDIQDGTLVTTDVEYTCNKIGLITPLSSELIDDAEVEIQGLVKDNFMEIATRKENVRILKVLKDNATEVSVPAGEEVDSTLENILDTALPSYKAGQMILCNPTGYSYLKNKKDKNGNKQNLISKINGIEYFNDYPIDTIDPKLITLSEGKTMLFYIANMKEAVLWAQRKERTIAISGTLGAGFDNDTTKCRILERAGAQKKLTRSIKKIEA